MEKEADLKTKKRVLDVGCGKRKTPGSIGVDANPDATAADALCNLNDPLPFPDNCFDEVRAVHLIEHVNDVLKSMSEFHRVTRPGGTLFLITPHYTDFISWCDPTHRWHLNSFSFRYFGKIHGERHWYTRLELRQRHLHVELARLWKMGGGRVYGQPVRLVSSLLGNVLVLSGAGKTDGIHVRSG